MNSFIVDIRIVFEYLIIFSSSSILIIGVFLSLYSSSNFCVLFLYDAFHLLFKCFSSVLLILNIFELILSICTISLYGNLNCDTLEIYGEFTGNGEVRELQVCKGGKVKGSLSYNTIVVEVGAIISGPMKPIDKDPVLLIENK